MSEDVGKSFVKQNCPEINTIVVNLAVKHNYMKFHDFFVIENLMIRKFDDTISINS